MPEITVEIDESILLKRMDMAKKNVTKIRPLLTTLGKVGVRCLQENILNQGRPNKFVPLSPVTIKLRKKMKGAWAKDNLALIVTGKLLKSNKELSQTNDTETIGTVLPYAAIHNFGGWVPASTIPNFPVKAHKRNGRKVRAFTRNQFMPAHEIPARRWANITKETLAAMQAAVYDYSMEGLN